MPKRRFNSQKEAVACLKRNGFAALVLLAGHAGKGSTDLDNAALALAYLVGGDWPQCISSNIHSRRTAQRCQD